jgi:hypothetical protein
VVSSVDGNYLRTPYTMAGWGVPNYNVLVGDTEAPVNGTDNEWQFVEGTSITAAAAVSPTLFLIWDGGVGCLSRQRIALRLTPSAVSKLQASHMAAALKVVHVKEHGFYLISDRACTVIVKHCLESVTDTRGLVALCHHLFLPVLHQKVLPCRTSALLGSDPRKWGCLRASI